MRPADVIEFICSRWVAANAVRDDPPAFVEHITSIQMNKMEMVVIDTMRVMYSLDRNTYVEWLRTHNMLPMLLFIDFTRAREELSWPSHTFARIMGGKIIINSSKERSKNKNTVGTENRKNTVKVSGKVIMPEALREQLIAELTSQ